MTAYPTFVHVGRAANCPCIDVEGQRCPHCNHLLTAEPAMVAGGEERMEHEEIKCSVCGHIESDEIISRDIRLKVQPIDQTIKSII